MKSCLKVSPPMTPDPSAPSTPGGSGRTSPTCSEDATRPGMRKAVSFCDEELEEVFFADEWDRSPVPVTPRLSYQDVLELKQLRLTLPRTPPSPTYRQPFTTSAPATPPPSFPVSRFAAQPSRTPDRWRNRRQDPLDLDPEILPYLDAVPIRLLPLLDNRASSPPPHMLPSSSVPETPQPSKPPALTVQVRSPAGTTASPVSPPTSPSTPSRTANFAFLPLLPVQEPHESAPVAPSAPPPSNRFNMTFLPLGVEVLEPEPMPSAQPPEPTQDASTPTHSPPPSSTPSLDASDTDTDTDAESDAPSTVASSLPSPPCSDEPEHDSSDPGYFNVPASAYFSQRMPTSDPGQTPPLSALYPTSPPSDPDATPVENALGSAKTHALRALPSPALVPPSPFTLNPPSPIFERHAQHIAGPPVGLGVQMDREREREKPPMTKRMFTAVRTQLHASVSADVGGQVRWVDVEEQSPDGVLRPSLSRREVA